MNKKHIKNDIIIVNILKFRKYTIIYEEEKMKSKFYIKALLIILLAVSLITIPNISNATERTANDESTLTSATDGDVINLSQDITITAPIEVSGKSITINGNGHSIIAGYTGTSGNKTILSAVSTGSVIKLKNITLKNSPKYGVQAYDGGKVILNQVTLSNNAYGGVLINGGTAEVINLSLIGNKTGIEISKSKSITSNNEPTLIMNGKLTSDATDNVIYLANDPNDNTTKFVIENTDNTENKILASGNKVVVTDVNNNILYTSNETTKQIDVEDYEENHPETEENNTIENDKVENPHTGDSILGYVATGIIAVMGIAILTKRNNK
jgi:hypothetical protein